MQTAFLKGHWPEPDNPFAGAMALASLAPAARACGDASAELLVPEDLRLSPEPCAALCPATPQAVLALTADGQLIHLTPTGGETAARTSTLLVLLGLAIRSCGLPPSCSPAPVASACLMVRFPAQVLPCCARSAAAFTPFVQI
jgi:hypothetical protein